MDSQTGDFLFEVRPAGAIARLVNFLVDGAVAPALAAWSVGRLGQVWEVDFLVEATSSFSFFLVFFVVHYLLGETVFQQTLGKMITRTYVASKDGNPPGFGAVALRTVIRFIPFEPLSIVGRRMWHDSWSDTTVARLPSKYDDPVRISQPAAAAETEWLEASPGQEPGPDPLV